MNEQLNIDAFHELLNSEGDSSSLLEILRGLREVSDPSEFTDKVKAEPTVGSWQGWAF